VLQKIHETQAPLSVKTQLIQSGLGAEEDIWAYERRVKRGVDKTT